METGELTYDRTAGYKKNQTKTLCFVFSQLYECAWPGETQATCFFTFL